MSYYQLWTIRILILIARMLVSKIDTSTGSGARRPELQLSMLESEMKEIEGIYVNDTYKLGDGMV